VGAFFPRKKQVLHRKQGMTCSVSLLTWTYRALLSYRRSQRDRRDRPVTRLQCRTLYTWLTYRRSKRDRRDRQVTRLRCRTLYTWLTYRRSKRDRRDRQVTRLQCRTLIGRLYRILIVSQIFNHTNYPKYIENPLYKTHKYTERSYKTKS
jgi:cbb3-type cytochrome oxidase subunit 3